MKYPEKYAWETDYTTECKEKKHSVRVVVDFNGKHSDITGIYQWFRDIHKKQGFLWGYYDGYDGVRLCPQGMDTNNHDGGRGQYHWYIPKLFTTLYRVKPIVIVVE